MIKENHPNALIRETSPYLLQHAYNPVQWEAWREPILQRAKDLNKPLLISIGYAACHWCHVMEHECFEDREVAEVMNSQFIPVKIDREERPDVDQIYMDALQIMTGSGGWPLNIVALPDGRPFWGATYLPKEKWIQAMVQLSRLYREDPEKVEQYAADLTTAVHKINEVLPAASSQTPDFKMLEGWIATWKPRFDPEYGGTRGAPKFMMPVRLQFLMHWGEVREDAEVRDHVKTSLRAMALGGLFDHLGGGFSRYSVDARWHVPHFEKMLYDNAQLISLYAQGYALCGESYMKEVVQRTIHFVQRELASPDGGYYASLDADSLDKNGSLREGAFYVWREPELREALGEDFELFAKAYNINTFGRWEDEQYVLIRRETDPELAKSLGLKQSEVRERLDKARNVLFALREQRERPKLDDKIITSWNALLLSGLADAARYGCFESAAADAEALAQYLCRALRQADGGLIHSTAKGTAGASGYLEDYASLIEGLIKVYSISGNLHWMEEAASLMEYVLNYFEEPGRALLYYNSRKDPELIRRSVEIADNVIPASNSIMAKNFFLLGLFYGRPEWLERAESMLIAVGHSLESYSGQYSNWLQLALWLERPFHELVVSGPKAGETTTGLGRNYLPHTLMAYSNSPSDYPLFKGRYHKDKTRIFLCSQGACQRPSEDADSVLKQLIGALR